MKPTNDNIEIGFCQCGCGSRVPNAPYTTARLDWVKGKPQHFLKGHHNRKSGADYLVEDRGYKTPCHIWQLSTTRYGYGMARDPKAGKNRLAHVLAYEAIHGPVPDGFELDHLCRVRACRNPEHLEPVTSAINNHRGNSTKLTTEQVQEIRAATHRYGTQSAFARKFGVSVACIHSALRGHTWKDGPLT